MKTKFFAVLACLTVGMIYVNDAKSTDFDVERFQSVLTYFNETVNDCKYTKRILHNRKQLNDIEKRLRFFCASVSYVNNYIVRTLKRNNDDLELVLNMESFTPNTDNKYIMNAMLSAYEHLRQPRYFGGYRIIDTLGYTVAHRNYSEEMAMRLNNLVISYENNEDGVVQQRFYLNMDYLNYLLESERDR